ncbi:MAG: hypothetical protein FWH11_01400 [Micrococcales bacterium]|nr:hypothetical protein [Micrococcales bacterium]
MHASTITESQAQALAALMTALRPDWDIPGCRTAIHAARHRGPAVEIVHAAVELTKRDDLKTPTVLAKDGKHWPSGTPKRDDHRFERCQVLGHGSYPASNCGACRVDSVEPSEPELDPGSEYYAEAAAVGVAMCREAINERRMQ